MGCENLYLWVQNKNYDGKSIVLKNDESVSSSEIVEKFKLYYSEKGLILKEIKGFKLTLYRKMFDNVAALMLDGHLLEKDHEARFVPFSYLIECDNREQTIMSYIDSFPAKMVKSLSHVQKQVDEKKIKDLFYDIEIKKRRKVDLTKIILVAIVLAVVVIKVAMSNR